MTEFDFSSLTPPGDGADDSDAPRVREYIVVDSRGQAFVLAAGDQDQATASGEWLRTPDPAEVFR